MAILDRLQKIEKKYVASLIGLVISIISILIGIYIGVYYTRSPNLKFSKISQSPIIDYDTEEENLKVFYKEINLKELDKTLSVLTLRIQNNGNEDLQENAFFNNIPLSYSFENAELVEIPNITTTQNEYIREIVRFNFDSLKNIIFEPFHLDKGDYFVLKNILIHDINQIPELKVKGKIRGIGEIKVETLTLESDKNKGIIERVFPGTIQDNFMRAITYFFLGMSIFSLIFQLLDFLIVKSVNKDLE